MTASSDAAGAFAAHGARVFLGDLDEQAAKKAAAEIRGRLTRGRTLTGLDASTRAGYDARVRALNDRTEG